LRGNWVSRQAGRQARFFWLLNSFVTVEGLAKAAIILLYAAG